LCNSIKRKRRLKEMNLQMSNWGYAALSLTEAGTRFNAPDVDFDDVVGRCSARDG
jgi:hypothetical protein